MARLIQRDPSSLEYLYDHYAGALNGVIVRIVKKEDIAEEVLQNVFLKIWDRIPGYDSAKGRLFTWMVNIARNQAIDKTRSREMSQGRKTDDLDLLVNKVDKQKSVEMGIGFIGIPEILAKLSEEQRFVIEKLYLGGYTQSEVSLEFDIPLGTVKTRTRMALSELRILLKDK